MSMNTALFQVDILLFSKVSHHVCYSIIIIIIIIVVKCILKRLFYEVNKQKHD